MYPLYGFKNRQSGGRPSPITGKAFPWQERLLHGSDRLWDAEPAKIQLPVSAGMEAALEAAFVFLGLGVPQGCRRAGSWDPPGSRMVTEPCLRGNRSFCWSAFASRLDLLRGQGRWTEGCASRLLQHLDAKRERLRQPFMMPVLGTSRQTSRITKALNLRRIGRPSRCGCPSGHPAQAREPSLT
jgi:hypothetical protein